MFKTLFPLKINSFHFYIKVGRFPSKSIKKENPQDHFGPKGSLLLDRMKSNAITLQLRA